MHGGERGLGPTQRAGPGNASISASRVGVHIHKNIFLKKGCKNKETRSKKARSDAREPPRTRPVNADVRRFEPKWVEKSIPNTALLPPVVDPALRIYHFCEGGG